MKFNWEEVGPAEKQELRDDLMACMPWGKENKKNDAFNAEKWNKVRGGIRSKVWELTSAGPLVYRSGPNRQSASLCQRRDGVCPE